VKCIRDPKAFQREMERLRLRGKAIGFVPTMGALHEGHLSLVRAARKENDVVAVSLFVNPLQFGPTEDFKKYPRPARSDRRKLRGARTDYLFAPDPRGMYPEGSATTVDAGSLAKVLCGRSRPGHFRAVATVVAKLFHLAKPHRAYFGAKDYQQALVIRRLVKDLDFDLECRVMPVVREADGLAMSSRNRYLDPGERRRAAVIPGTLLWVHGEFARGKRDLGRIRREAVARLRAQVSAVDYFEIADPETLEPLKKAGAQMQVLTACFMGKTRLIDNVRINLRPTARISVKAG
jgi:pantoate--beta-alanine ligase